MKETEYEKTDLQIDQAMDLLQDVIDYAQLLESKAIECREFLKDWDRYVEHD